MLLPRLRNISAVPKMACFAPGRVLPPNFSARPGGKTREKSQNTLFSRKLWAQFENYVTVYYSIPPSLQLQLLFRCKKTKNVAKNSFIGSKLNKNILFVNLYTCFILVFGSFFTLKPITRLKIT